MRNYIILPLIMAFLAITAPATAATFPPDAIAGIWEVADGTGKIEIYSCGDRYCGKIVWIKEPLYPADDSGGMPGKPLLDRENPKKELRSRPQLGLRIMESYTYSPDNLWDQGKIYNTENGKTYSSRIRLQSLDRLELRGFIGIPLLGGSTVWKRVQQK
jgi:uncharacterized protein (DUF2147 family)